MKNMVCILCKSSIHRFTTETQKHYSVLVVTKSGAALKPIRSNLLFCGLSMYTINGAYGTLFVTRFLVSFLKTHHTWY
uniref:Uncharacterized protein n=1 Tax=Helianthus annuus TaxID=4232 RepID=A0A251VLD9_HELAN